MKNGEIITIGLLGSTIASLFGGWIVFCRHWFYLWESSGLLVEFFFQLFLAKVPNPQMELWKAMRDGKGCAGRG